MVSNIYGCPIEFELQILHVLSEFFFRKVEEQNANPTNDLRRSGVFIRM